MNSKFDSIDDAPIDVVLAIAVCTLIFAITYELTWTLGSDFMTESTPTEKEK